MKQSLALTAIFEAATGLVLIIAPSLVGRLLFGAEFTGVANPAARVTGIALLALGVGCWPGSTALCGHVNIRRARHALPGLPRRYRRMGRAAIVAGVVIHALLTTLLARAWFQSRKPG
jgi:uncharacterized protein YjeT (DUF2065 family)